MRRIVAIEFDFGGNGLPYVYFHTSISETDDKSRKMVIGSYDDVYKLEDLTAGWPAYMDIPNRCVRLKRPGFQSEDEYQAALKRLDELMDAEPNSPEEAELDRLSQFIVMYEDIHYHIDPPNDPNQSWE